MMEDIARELNRQRRSLHLMRSLSPVGAAEEIAVAPSFKAHEVDRMLRIEIERDGEEGLFRYLHETGQLFDGGRSFYDHEGPRKFQGVDVYMVDRLPAPGWRIVNPFARQS